MKANWLCLVPTAFHAMLCKRVSVRAMAKPRPSHGQTGCPRGPTAHSWPGPGCARHPLPPRQPCEQTPDKGSIALPVTPGLCRTLVVVSCPRQCHTRSRVRGTPTAPCFCPHSGALAHPGAAQAAASWGQEARTALSASLPAGAPNTGQDGMRDMRSPAGPGCARALWPEMDSVLPEAPSPSLDCIEGLAPKQGVG